MVGLHILLATAHVVLRVPERNPEAERQGAVLDQARLEFEGHDCRAIADPHLPVGPSFDRQGPAKGEVRHRARLVLLVDDAVHLDLLAVAVRDRHQVVLQEQPGGLIRQRQGCDFTRLEAGVRTHLSVHRFAQRARDRLCWLGHRLLALNRKLMHATQGASCGYASTPGLIT